MTTDIPTIARAFADHLPLPDESVDEVITSPPYFNLRSYRDHGAAMDGQIGNEPSPAQYVAALIRCTREWARVLKPGGSIFVNLGDAYSAYNANRGPSRSLSSTADGARQTVSRGLPPGAPRAKSTMGLPWRYAIACMDQLDLILRRDIIWDKVNGLPESVGDRAHTAHEYIFHLVKQPRYYSAMDELREPAVSEGLTYEQRITDPRFADTAYKNLQDGQRAGRVAPMASHPLGRAPGSVWHMPPPDVWSPEDDVWSMTLQPLIVPKWLGLPDEHFAAFPVELPRRAIIGWSPPAICDVCGVGRWPVVHRPTTGQDNNEKNALGDRAGLGNGCNAAAWKAAKDAGGGDRILGYACKCTPYTDHPGSGQPFAGLRHSGGAQGPNVAGTRGVYHIGDHVRTDDRDTGLAPRSTRGSLGKAEKVGPWREFHLDEWTPPPSHPAIVIDPFGGTGTTALAAAMLGRRGISFDMSAGYCKLAHWRVRDPGERARAAAVPRPPRQLPDQGALFGLDELAGL